MRDVFVAAIQQRVVDERQRLQQLVLGVIGLRIILEILAHVHIGVHQRVM